MLHYLKLKNLKIDLNLRSNISPLVMSDRLTNKLPDYFSSLKLMDK